MTRRRACCILMLLLVGSFCLLADAYAATYYIDYSSGADGNNGTSQTTPWQHLPGMVGCSNNCSAHTPAGGDQFILKGGVTWPNAVFPIYWQWSGTSASPIYIGVSSNYYTGASWTRPVFNAGGAAISGSNNFFIRFASSSYSTMANYVELDNIEMTGFYWNNAPAYGAGNYIVTTGATYITLNHLYLHGWTYGTSASGEIDIVLGYNQSYGNEGNIFENGIISNSDNGGTYNNSGQAFYVFGSVSNSSIHDCSNGILYYGPAVINNNVIYNIIESKFASHPNFIESLGGPSSAFSVYVYDNIFHDGVGEAYYFGDSSYETDYVYNNLWYNLGENVPEGENAAAAYFWNNTIVAPAGQYCIHGDDKGGTYGTLVVANNHCITTASATWNAGSPATTVTTLTQSNNLVQTPTAATAQGYTVSNQYVPTAGGGTIGAGLNLTSNVSTYSSTGLNYDLIGTARPSSGAWGIGAYQYTSSSFSGPSGITLANPTITASASPSGYGSISPSGSVGIPTGAGTTFIITPQSGHSIANVLVDGVSVGAVSSYPFNSVVANHTISATFQ
jgi:hypothetical protein